jgi:hypothetical protein
MGYTIAYTLPLFFVLSTISLLSLHHLSLPSFYRLSTVSLPSLYHHHSTHKGTKQGKYFDSEILHGTTQRLTISMAFKELEALERTLDDEIDALCSKIVAQEEKSTVHGVSLEKGLTKNIELHLITAGRLKRMLPTLRERELVRGWLVGGGGGGCGCCGGCCCCLLVLCLQST